MRLSPLTRRQALQAIGSTAILSLAGCTTEIGNGGEPTDHTTGEPEPASPTATLSPVREDEFEFEVAVLNQFTSDQPASVRFSFTNTSNRSYILTPTEFGPIDQGYVVAEADSAAKIVLANSGIRFYDSESDEYTEPPREPRNGCWTLDAELEYPVGVTYGEVPPGETISEDFTCYAHRENENCLPVGEYRFTEKHELEPGTVERDGRRGPSVSFEFLISLLIDDSGSLSVEVEY